MTTKEEAPAKTLAELGLENFLMLEIHRSQLVGAEYNPRQISDNEKSKLKKALERHGMVQPVVWNERSGRLVGGHQRLSILDSLAGTKNYKLTVSRIDVDDSREKEINIVLNNTAAMGQFDLEKLGSIFEDESVTIGGAGFADSDMVALFGDSVFDNRSEDLKNFAEHLATISERYNTVQERNRKKGESEHYLVFVFPDGACVDALIKKFGLQDNRYQPGLFLLDKLGVPQPEG